MKMSVWKLEKHITYTNPCECEVTSKDNTVMVLEQQTSVSSKGRIMTKRKYSENEMWKKARRLCKLNSKDIQMAKAKNLSPSFLISHRPNMYETWKKDIKEYIYEKV